METIDIRRFEDTFVIHFGTRLPRLNAYTLASSLVAIADAAKAANASLNPGYEIEIVVEALSEGSFRATVKAVFSGAGNLFSKQNLHAIILSVIASHIYTKTLAPTTNPTVIVNTNEVIVEQGETRIIVPRHVHDAGVRVAHNPEFQSGIARIFQAAIADPEVSYVGIAPTGEDLLPTAKIPRDRFPILANSDYLELPGSREFIETADLQITRAILERGRKRWQFVWRGVRISAPVLDDRFYDRFFAHEIMIAPGDALKVRLRVRQVLDFDTGILVNDSNGYEVLEVLEHRPRAKQTRVPMD